MASHGVIPYELPYESDNRRKHLKNGGEQNRGKIKASPIIIELGQENKILG